jgi:hypothetical protein
MRSILFALSLITAAGCSQGAEPTATAQTAQAAVAVPATLTLQPTTVGICPHGWTCDDVAFYSTKGACLAACGSGCFVDYNCNGRCLCP